MFYSHTFLARKGPLGTVWCAAHLQHRLKKSHYTSTDIASTVERIMHPEVPIALRMSGHLLLGVVRIYSKQVDYLYQDCNVALVGISKAYTSVNINLPEDATQAPFHAVTLPETFSLDALELDGHYQDRSEDNHRKRLEEITLEDQIPTGTDPYIVIILNEDVRNSSPVPGDALDSGPVPMEEDSHPLVPVVGATDHGDPSPSNQARLNEKNIEDGTPQDLPDFEIMRDASHDFHVDNSQMWPDHGNDVVEPDRVLEELIMKDKEAKEDNVMEPDRVLEELIMKDKEATSPQVGEILASGGSSLRAHQPRDSSPGATEQTRGSLDLHFSLRHDSPELAIRSTPPAQQRRARQKKRRREFFDESTVFTNRFMKRALEDTSNLLRERKNCPSTNIGLWKLNNRLNKDLIFVKPLITGMSSEVQSIYDPQFISSKPHLNLSDEIHQDADVPKAPPLRDDIEMEIEHLRDNAVPEVNNTISVILPSPVQPASPPATFMPSPSGGDKSTPATLDVGSRSGQMGTDIGPDSRPTIDFTPSTGHFSSDMETPATYSVERQGVQNTGLSDIPELPDSAGDLNFLEQDDNTPAGSQGTPETGHMTGTQREAVELDALSARTRAVAQYLRRQSSATPNSDQSSGNLSLNSILEHKSRKICARMFFETLVLKNCGLVDVHQEEPYDDIKLRVTPKLSKEHPSS